MAASFQKQVVKTEDSHNILSATELANHLCLPYDPGRRVSFIRPNLPDSHFTVKILQRFSSRQSCAVLTEVTSAVDSHRTFAPGEKLFIKIIDPVHSIDSRERANCAEPSTASQLNFIEFVRSGRLVDFCRQFYQAFDHSLYTHPELQSLLATDSPIRHYGDLCELLLSDDNKLESFERNYKNLALDDLQRELIAWILCREVFFHEQDMLEEMAPHSGSLFPEYLGSFWTAPECLESHGNIPFKHSFCSGALVMKPITGYTLGELIECQEKPDGAASIIKSHLPRSVNEILQIREDLIAAKMCSDFHKIQNTDLHCGNIMVKRAPDTGQYSLTMVDLGAYQRMAGTKEYPAVDLQQFSNCQNGHQLDRLLQDLFFSFDDYVDVDGSLEIFSIMLLIPLSSGFPRCLHSKLPSSNTFYRYERNDHNLIWRLLADEIRYAKDFERSGYHWHTLFYVLHAANNTYRELREERFDKDEFWARALFLITWIFTYDEPGAVLQKFWILLIKVKADFAPKNFDSWLSSKLQHRTSAADTFVSLPSPRSSVSSSASSSTPSVSSSYTECDGASNLATNPNIEERIIVGDSRPTVLRKHRWTHLRSASEVSELVQERLQELEAYHGDMYEYLSEIQQPQRRLLSPEPEVMPSATSQSC